MVLMPWLVADGSGVLSKDHERHMAGQQKFSKTKTGGRPAPPRAPTALSLKLAGGASISSNGRQPKALAGSSANHHFSDDGPRRIIEESLANSGWLKLDKTSRNGSGTCHWYSPEVVARIAEEGAKCEPGGEL